MCGIAAVFEKGGARAEELDAMASAMAHRGPDDSGVWADGPAGLGHRRLSIIDLSAAGRQPMANEDGSIRVVFNGEIYNFESLRAELEARGHRFRSRTDSEVIPHAYEEFGEACLERFRGMFAFALWDGRRSRLFAARDRFGIKPLYYRSSPGSFACASEIRALLARPGVPREADPSAVREYVRLRCVRSPRTFLRGIMKLPPGHYLLKTEGGLEVRRWWLPPEPAELLPLEEAAGNFLREFRAAVKLHLISDVPVGLFLSGGLDSSVLAAVAAGEAGGALRTFTAAFPGGGWHDEARYAAAVARHIGSRHQEIPVEPGSWELLRTVTRSLEEPISDPAALPTYLLAREARKAVTVVLTGEGADETHAGYDKYRRASLAAALDRLPAAARAAARAAASVLPGRAGRAARWLLSEPAARLEVDRYSSLEASLGLKFWAGSEAANSGAELDARPAGDPLAAALARDLLGWMPDDLLVKVDKTTMAHALEARVPYLDHVAAATVLGLAPAVRANPWTTKRVLRRAARGLIPESIRGRRQHGFNVPVHDWFRGGPSEADRLLDPGLVRRRGYFDPGFVSAALARHRAGKVEAGLLLWTLCSLELWHEEFTR